MAVLLLLPDSVELDAVDVLVGWKAASAPVDNHGGLEVVPSGLLQHDHLTPVSVQYQLPAHIQVPAKIK